MLFVRCQRNVSLIGFSALLVLFLSTLLLWKPTPVYAQNNPTYLENQNQGTDQWALSNPADDVNLQIKGYASATSVDQGDSITLFVSTNPAQSYSIEIYRMGWYGGKGGRLTAQIPALSGSPQLIPSPDPATGLLELAWNPSYVLPVPSNWTSGVYLAKLTNTDGYDNYIVFVVRDDDRTADFLFQQSVTTYQAYNNFPNDGVTGKSVYKFNSDGPNTVSGAPTAVKLSFDRPYANAGSGDFFAWEWDLIYWMERAGYDVTYVTNIDTHENGADLLNHTVFLSTGHDEYWTKEMYDAAELARDNGTHLAFMGANAVYWQIRFEASATSVPNRVMVSYKNASIDPEPDIGLKTILFKDAGRPEQRLRGVTFGDFNNDSNTDYIVENSGHWIYNETGFADGDRILGIIGYEVDGYDLSIPEPNYTVGDILSSSPFVAKDGANVVANTVLFQAPSGAWVFSSGTMSWSSALNAHWEEDSRMQQTTANLFDELIGSASAPTIVNPGYQSSFNDETISLAIAASDPSSGTLTYAATGLPGGLSIDPNTGVISGQFFAGRIRENKVAVTVNNGSESTSTYFSWQVNRAGAGACRAGTQEAEWGKLFGNFSIKADPDASGGEYIRTLNGSGTLTHNPYDRVEFCFTVPTAGNYRIRGWAKAPDYDSNSFYYTVDGLPANAYVWTPEPSSDFQADYLGNAEVVDQLIIGLAPGNHTVTLYQHEDGIGLDKLELELLLGNIPTVTITAPTDGITLTQGSLAQFAATATDVEDGELSSVVSWNSSLDGVLGTGATISTVGLSPGTHQISASAVDSNNYPDSDSINIVVEAPTELPGASIQIAPQGTIVDNPPTFSWYEATDATSYRILLRNTDTGVILVNTTFGLTDLTCSGGICTIRPIDTAYAAGNYRWNMLAKNINGSGPWSGNMDFEIDEPSPPPLGTPQLLSPLGTITSDELTFGWSAVSTATHYTLVIFSLSTDAIVYQQSHTAAEAACDSGDGSSASGSTCSIQPVGLLLPIGSYTWIVRAETATTTGDWGTYLGQ